MKILLIDNDVMNEYEGGLYIYKTTGEFGVELFEKGYQVEFFQTKLYRRSAFHSFNLKKYNFKITISKRYPSKLLTYILAYSKAIGRLFETDFLYVYYPTNYHFLCFFAILMGRKFGLNVRGQERFDSYLSRYLFRKADIICTVSDTFTNLVNGLGGNAFTQRPILNDVFFLDNKVRDYSSRNLYKLLFVGRLDLEKGLIELLEAVSSLRAKGISVLLNIVGDGQDGGIILEKINSLQLNNIVFLNGAVHDGIHLKQYYVDSDIFILPSYHEGFPRVVYEAMLTRVPVVTTIVGGMDVLMQDGFNCIEILSRSSESIVIKLESLIKHYERSSELCENAYISVRKYFEQKSLRQSDIIHEILSQST